MSHREGIVYIEANLSMDDRFVCHELEKDYRLPGSLATDTRLQFLWLCLILFISVGLKCCQPLVVKLFITFEDMDGYKWHGYIYTVLLVLMNILSSLLNAYYIQAIKCLAMKITSSVMSAVYRKSLVLSNGAKRLTSYGDITNLMAVDCQRVNDYAQWLAYIIVIPLQIIL
ncbi:multidrug resistance-associated protein 1-like, partial [Oppia nitens]|uniref:multidrug resistance-associated protein 1-like n=1 Tax=Oppia nitens TaxID=1686743 RepID=UPI0023DCA4F2